MLLAADIVGWLKDTGFEHPVFDDPELPAMPDRVVAVTRVGGAPTTVERGFDTPQIQVVARGAQTVPSSAERVADEVDDLLLGAVPPVVMGGHRVISIDRLGGPPQAFDRDPGRRILCSCNYLLRVARAVL